jgi:predicted DNA-binding transcriptional regulator YafY
MRSSRLLEMLLLLQARGSVTAAELAQRLEVSPRTVYRDADALNSAGVPIYTERGRGGGISLLPGYRADLTGLTRDEARALFIRAATCAVQEDLGLGGPLLRSALTKMLRAVPAPFRDSAMAVSERILVDPVGWMRPPHSGPPDVLGTLQTAVFADRRVRLRYQSIGSPQASWRIVDPYGLVCKSGTWYLVADHEGEARLYRVSRASAAEVDEALVRRRNGATLAGLWEGLRRQVDDKPMPVRVVARVRRSRIDMVTRVCAPNVVTVSDDDAAGDEAAAGHGAAGGGAAGDGVTSDGVTGDGVTGETSAGHGVAGDGVAGEGVAGGEEWVEAELRFPAVVAARILLGFGTDVEIVSPPEVRDDLLAVATEVVARG